MIVVKVELWPHGFAASARQLGELRIWNTGQGTLARGEYQAELFGQQGRKMGTTDLQNWPRKSKNVWDLVLQILKQLRADGDVQT